MSDETTRRLVQALVADDTLRRVLPPKPDSLPFIDSMTGEYVAPWMHGVDAMSRSYGGLPEGRVGPTMGAPAAGVVLDPARGQPWLGRPPSPLQRMMK